MREHFLNLLSKQGIFVGKGRNHENQPFTGTLTLTSILSGRGIQIQFEAKGNDGTVYHSEHSLISFADDEKLHMWNLNSNVPCVLQHKFDRVDKVTEGTAYIFSYNNKDNLKVFREEIAFEIFDDGQIGYRYSWGMPGQHFAPRSGLKLTQAT